MNPPQYRQNTICQYAMSERNIVGEIKESKENYDLMTIIMICLGDSEKVEADLLKMLNQAMAALQIPEEKREAYRSKIEQ